MVPLTQFVDESRNGLEDAMAGQPEAFDMGERSWRFERELLGASHICPFRSFSWKPLAAKPTSRSVLPKYGPAHRIISVRRCLSLRKSFFGQQRLLHFEHLTGSVVLSIKDLRDEHVRQA